MSDVSMATIDRDDLVATEAAVLVTPNGVVGGANAVVAGILHSSSSASEEERRDLVMVNVCMDGSGVAV